jgi:hypothetical protein
LTEGPDQAYDPSWSPDGGYIFHSATGNFGTGAGWFDTGSWLVSADGKEIIRLPYYKGDDHLVAWLSPSSLLVFSYNQLIYNGLEKDAYYVFNIKSRKVEFERRGPIQRLFFDPISGRLITMEIDPMIETSLQWVYFVFDSLYSQPVELDREYFQDLGYPLAMTYPGHPGSFLVSTDKYLLEINATNEIRIVSSKFHDFPTISPSGDYWAWETYSLDGTGGVDGVRISSPEGINVRRIFTQPTLDGFWSMDGGYFFFIQYSTGNLFVAKSPDFIPVLIANNIFAPDQIWLQP